MHKPRDLSGLLNLPPASQLSGAVAIGLGVVVFVVLLATRQPWLGLELAADGETNGVIVRESTGPGQAILQGTVLVRVSNAADRLEIEALDIVAEPDGAMGDFTTYRRFLQRQERLAQMQRSPEVIFHTAEGETFVVNPELGGRPLASLPVEYWVQVIVGLVAWLVSASVFVFRPQNSAARYLLLSGFATLTFAPLAAVYSTRELALPGTLFQWLNDLNFLGGSLFAASFVAMLLHYPRRIVPGWAGIGAVGIYVVWYAVQQAGVFESMTFARRFLVLVGVLLTFILAAVHWLRTRKDPVGRAALQWFLMAWMAGTLLFALFILLPQLFGIDTSGLQGYAFLLFLLVYGGLAFGILRYRLFELGDWWRRIAVWTIGVLLLILLDLLFVMRLHMSGELSLSLALIVCGLIWLPVRGFIWGRFVGGRQVRGEDRVAGVMAVALAPPGGDGQLQRWERLLRDLFDPLSVEEAGEPVGRVSIVRDGLVLQIPSIGEIPGLRLAYARGGRSLFTPGDAARAAELANMLGHAIKSRSAYEKGVEEERSRIARDMHDNLGAQLLTALRSREPGGKDTAIRQALTDLRDVINDISGKSTSLEEILASLRLETVERLASAGIGLSWDVSENAWPACSGKIIHTIRSLVREAVSNVVRHSGAQSLRIVIKNTENDITICIEDDGCGFDAGAVHEGNGIINMRARAEDPGGSLEIVSGQAGTRITIHIPV